MRPVEMGEVVRLEEHVAELGERQPALQPDLDRVLGEHVRDREVLAGVAQEVDQASGSSQSRLLTITAPEPGVKSRNRSSWTADRRDVRLERLAIEQVPLRRPTRRVADHPRPAADHGDRPAAEPLQPEQPEDRDEVADVERRARRVEPDVPADRSPRRQASRQARRRGVQDPPPFEFGQQSARPGLGRAPVTGASVESSRPTGRRRTVPSPPYAIVRP